MMMRGTASQDGSLAQPSKVSQEKPPIKKPQQVRKTFLNASGDIQKIIIRMDTYQKNYEFINQINQIITILKIT